MPALSEAKHIAMEYALTQWPKTPMEFELHQYEESPSGVYAIDNRHLEPGWYHFTVTGTYLGVCGCPFLSVYAEAGEVRSLGMVGE